MTCITGLAANGKVYLGGDIQGTGGNHKTIHTQPKVFNKKNVIFGYTSSYRFGQILEHNLPDPVVPEDPADIYRWLIVNLIPDIKRVLEDNDCKGGNCLIGVRDQLWELQSDFSVLRSVNGYASVGSGSEYALGSLCTNISLNSANTDTMIRMAITEAIRVASVFSPSVGRDATIIST